MGHAGTLDPFATGLLLIAIGHATRLLSYYTHAKKTYRAFIEFGIKTETGDPEGEVIENKYIPLKIEESVLKDFVLSLKKQRPSKYSAIKINGKKAYDLARKKVEFEMPEKEIEILNFRIISFSYPNLEYIAEVSSGCYIRTLTEQIAENLEQIAMTKELERIAIDQLELTESVQLSALNGDNWQESLLDYQQVFPNFNRINFNEEEQKSFQQGKNIINKFESNPKKIIVYNDKSICIGVAQQMDNYLKPLMVFNYE